MEPVIPPILEYNNPRSPNICCCCLKQDHKKDLSSVIEYQELNEVYRNMFMETFGIQLSACKFTQQQQQLDITNNRIMVPCVESNYNCQICERCASQLQTATLFKQMIKRSLAVLEDYLKNTVVFHDSKMEIENENNTVKVETFDETDLMNDTTGDDHEVLSEVKIKTTTSIEEETNYNRSKNYEKLEKRTNRKKCKIKSNCNKSEELGHQDWKKILERRGNGPILRENTLKLLANSTICVFQWNKSRYRCFCCKEPFSDLHLLREHSNTNHALEEIEKKIILQQNRLVKVEVSRISCKLCPSELQNLLELRHHLIEKHGIIFTLEEDLLVPFKINSDLKCQICLEQFTMFRLLNIHMNKHFQKQVCHICGTGFSNLVFLNLHKTRSHRPLTCKECEVMFANKAEKRKHDSTVHGVKIERKLRFPCPYCQDRFFQENFRVQHLVEKHGMAKPEHKCTVCSKVFITRSLRNNHVKNVHMKEKNQECDICHHFFYTKSDVLRHRVTHTGEKKFCCSICTSPFASKDSLRRHMKRTHVAL